MTNLPGWLKFGDKVGVLTEIEDWLGPVVEAATKWKEIGQAVLTLGEQAQLDDPAKVIGYVLDHINDKAVKDIFSELGLSATYTKLVTVKSKVNESQWSKLLQPLSELSEQYTKPADDDRLVIDEGTNEGLIELAIPTQTVDGITSIGAGDFGFSVSGEAKMQLEAGSVWPFRGDTVDPGLLKIGAQGGFTAKAGLTVPYSNFLTFDADAGASLETQFAYFYRPKNDQLFASAILPALKSMPDPFDMQSISNASRLGDFEGLVLFIDGSVEAGIEVGLGKDLTIPKFVKGRAELFAAIAFQRRAAWVLSLRKRGGGFDIVLSRAKASEREWSVGINLSVDASGLFQQVNKSLLEVSDFSGPLLNKIKPFLSPGTYVLGELSSQLEKVVASFIADENLARAVVADASILLGDETAGELELDQWLSTEIATALDSVTGGVTADANQLMGSVLERLDKQIPSFVPESIGEVAKSKLEDLINQLKIQFDQLTADLVSGKPSTDAIAKELSEIGIKVKGGAKKADNALGGVRKLVSQYESFLQEVVSVTAQGEKAKLEAKFAFFGEAERRSHYELLGHISEVNDETSRLWRSLAHGKMQPFQRMLQDPDLVPDGFQIDPESAVERFAHSQKGFALSVAIFDVQLEFEAIANGSALIREQNGRVVVAAAAKAKRRLAFLDVARESNFISLYDLIESKSPRNKDRSLTFSVDLIRKDEKLSSEELKNFLAGLKDNRLISDTRAIRAEAIRHGNLLPGDDKVRGDVAIRLALTPLALSNLLSIGRMLSHGNDEVHKAIFLLAVRVLIDAGLGREDVMRNALRWIGEEAKLSDAAESIYAKRLNLPRPASGGIAAKVEKPQYRLLKRLRDRANDLISMFETITSIYDAIPDPAGEAGWDRFDYEKEEERLAGAAKNWIKLKEDFQTRMHPNMLGLLRIMVALSQFPLESKDNNNRSAELIGNMIAPLDVNRSDAQIVIKMVLGEKGNPHLV